MKWSRKDKIKDLSEPGMHHLIFRKDGQICCFLSVLACKEANLRRRLIPVLYIYELHVLPAYQRHGLGAWLLNCIITRHLTAISVFSECVRVMLTCHTANERAMAFYLKHGFQPDEVCPSQCLSKTEAARTGYKILSKPILLVDQ